MAALQRTISSTTESDDDIFYEQANKLNNNVKPEVATTDAGALDSNGNDVIHGVMGKSEQGPSIVEGLLVEIYDRWQFVAQRDSVDSDTFTESSSVSEVCLKDDAWTVATHGRPAARRLQLAALQVKGKKFTTLFFSSFIFHTINLLNHRLEVIDF